MLDYNRLTYAESAALADRSALFPERTPSAAAVERLHTFTERLNSIMVLYFNRDTRMDSREKRRKAARKLIF